MVFLKEFFEKVDFEKIKSVDYKKHEALRKCHCVSTVVNHLRPSVSAPFEPQILHFVNFTPCEKLIPIRHFWQM